MTNVRLTDLSDTSPKKLNTSVAPLPGESLRGFVARACRANWLPNSWGLLQPLGLRNRNRVNIAESAEIDLKALAVATGAKESEIQSRFYRDIGLRHGEFFGIQLSRLRIENNCRRFAPASLSFQNWHLAAWELRDLPFCVESWEMLQDTCPCPFEEPTKQRWTRTLTRVDECDRCGELLSRLPAHIVPENERNGLELLRGLFAPAMGRAQDLTALPLEIRSVCAGRVYETIIQLSQIAKGSVIPGLPAQFASEVSRIRSACNAILCWPHGFRGDWIDPVATEYAIGARRQAYLALANNLDASLVELKVQQREKREMLPSERKPEVKGSVRKRGRTPEQKKKKAQRDAARRSERAMAKAKLPIGLRRASELAHLDPETLLAARDEGLLSDFERLHGARVVPAFNPKEVIDLGERWNSRLPASTVAFEFGISRFGVEQLGALRVLPSDAPHLHKEGPHFTRAAVDNFVSKLKSVSCDTIHEGVTLRDTLHDRDLRPKPWGPAIALLLNDQIPFSLNSHTPFRLDRLTVHPDYLDKFVNLSFERAEFPREKFCDTMVQRDVCECFNLFEKDGQHLQFLPHTGKMPRLYDTHAVEEFRVKAITLYEISKITCLRPSEVTRRLEKAAVDHWPGSSMGEQPSKICSPSSPARPLISGVP